ncbi:MAG: hypothetical protein M1819_006318 [Sarea resinae]|nr:MAG: hypothetical protein M1819_006318 [Sarea resinae]
MTTQSTTESIPNPPTKPSWLQFFVVVYPLMLFSNQLVALVQWPPSPPFSRNVTNGWRVLSAIMISGQWMLAVWQLKYLTDDSSRIMGISTLWSQALATVEKVLFASPRGPHWDYWQVVDVREPRTRPRSLVLAGPSSLSLSQRLKWALGLIFNPRGIGWNFQLKHVSAVNPSRLALIVGRTKALFWTVLLVDLSTQVTLRTSFASSHGSVGKIDSRHITLRDPNFVRGFTRTLAFGSSAYLYMSMTHLLTSIVAVGTGLSAPQALEGFTGAFTDMLGCQRGTRLAASIQLWTAFTISGFLHAVQMLALPVPPSASGLTLSDRSMGFFYFFVLQAAAITVEDVFMGLYGRYFGRGGSGGKTIGRKEKTRGSDTSTAASTNTSPSPATTASTSSPSRPWTTYLGYFWVTAWFWFSIPFAGDLLLRLRLGDKDIFPVSPAKLALDQLGL